MARHRLALVWYCMFLSSLGVWERLRFVIVALPGLFSYLFYIPFERRTPAGFGAFFNRLILKSIGMSLLVGG